MSKRVKTTVAANMMGFPSVGSSYRQWRKVAMVDAVVAIPADVSTRSERRVAKREATKKVRAREAAIRRKFAEKG